MTYALSIFVSQSTRNRCAGQCSSAQSGSSARWVAEIAIEPSGVMIPPDGSMQLSSLGDTMSDISARLISLPGIGVRLNAQVFHAGMVGFLIGDFTAIQVLTFLNDHIAENGGTSLTANEQMDLSGPAPSLEATYGALTTDGARALWFHRLSSYTQELQDGGITQATWDNQFGL